MIPEIGFSTNVLNNPADVLKSVEIVSQHFKKIELELGDDAELTVYQANPSQYKDIVDAMKRLIIGQDISLSIHAPFVGHNLAAEDERERRESIERLMKTIFFARDIGSKKVTFHPGLNGQRPNEKTMLPLMRSLEKIVPKASEMKVQLCLENMGNERPAYIVYTPEEQKHVAQEAGVEIALDVIHLASVLSVGSEFYEGLEILAPHIASLHVADMLVPSHVHLPIGNGNLPLTPILKKLYSLGYRGPAIVEEFDGVTGYEFFIERARAYRNQVLGEIAS